MAHAIAERLPCPAICRDEIKEGMVHACGAGFEPAAGDPLTRPTLAVFFEALRLMITAEVTVVAEANFQDQLWRSGLEPLADLARLRIVQCHVDPALARERREAAARRESRRFHGRIIGEEIEDCNKYWHCSYCGFDSRAVDRRRHDTRICAGPPRDRQVHQLWVASRKVTYYRNGR